MEKATSPVVLRFSDFKEQNIITIDEHKSVLSQHGKVYWGLWHKSYEEISSKPSSSEWVYKKFGKAWGSFSTPCTIFLCNISNKEVYIAMCSKIIISNNVQSNANHLIPAYYRNLNLSPPPIYFSLKSIEKVNYNTFYNKHKEKLPFSSDDTLLMAANIKHTYINIDKNSILHISDLHFGSSCNYKEGQLSDRGNKPYLKEKFLKLCAQHKDDIGLIVVSGDFSYGKDRKSSQESHRKNFSAAEKFLRELCDIFQLDPAQRLILVPGNHDKGFVDETNETSAIILKTDNDYDQDYRNFQNELIGEEQLTYLRKYCFPNNLKVNIACFDSSDIQSKRLREYGYIESRQFEIVDGIDRDSHINLAIMHYPLIPPPTTIELSPYADDNGKYHAEAISVIENGFEVALKLTQKNFKYILHGHQHYPYLGKYVMDSPNFQEKANIGFLSAGSLGLNNISNHYPNFPYNSFNIYTLSKNSLKVCIYKFLSNEPPQLYGESTLDF